LEPKLHEEYVYTPALPEGVDTLMPGMVKLPEGFEGRLMIPESVLIIGDCCFYEEPISAVSLPKSLRRIGLSAFEGCRLKEIRVEGDGEKIIIGLGAFMDNPELTAITLGNCGLCDDIFNSSPVSRVKLTGECIHYGKNPFGFGCHYNRNYEENFFETVRDKYGGALGTYILKGKLVKTNYKQYVHKTGKQMHYVDIEACKDCDKHCYTLEGFENDRCKAPVFEWEKVE